MAGFKDKPFHLPRDELAPPIDLQKIFPWIEEAVGKPDSRERRIWEKQCLEDMTDMRRVTHIKDAPEVVQEDYENESSIGKVKFLQLLVYLRRVIFQDAMRTCPTIVGRDRC